MDRKTTRALGRGRRRADASLDLHGLDQALAHASLLRFLRGAQAAGHGLVLVVTGKGRPGEEGRGVLKRLVPLWLSAPDLRPLVLGLAGAGPRQGGGGALYVRLRRLRTRA